MRYAAIFICFFVLCSEVLSAQETRSRQSNVQVAPVDFSGGWWIDLRTPDQKKTKVECGGAYFYLTQEGNRIRGDHSFATAHCGRLNEGGPETVKGVIVGVTAVMTVQSGRNGAVVLGLATRDGKQLRWETVDDIVPGSPEGDSALILSKGLLSRVEQPAKIPSPPWPAFTPNSASSRVQRKLQTENFDITVQACREDEVSCDDVQYYGQHKRTGRSLELKGRTHHTTCTDGITPCTFQGYLFQTGNITYHLSESGTLLVTRATANGSVVLVNESGKWLD